MLLRSLLALPVAHEDNPFHRDYCYVPKAWQSRIEHVEIASFSEFAALSDDRPLSGSLRTA
jgi:hypothetical protein